MKNLNSFTKLLIVVLTLFHFSLKSSTALAQMCSVYRWNTIRYSSVIIAIGTSLTGGILCIGSLLTIDHDVLGNVVLSDETTGSSFLIERDERKAGVYFYCIALKPPKGALPVLRGKFMIQ